MHDSTGGIFCKRARNNSFKFVAAAVRPVLNSACSCKGRYTNESAYNPNKCRMCGLCPPSTKYKAPYGYACRPKRLKSCLSLQNDKIFGLLSRKLPRQYTNGHKPTKSERHTKSRPIALMLVAPSLR